MLFRINTVEIHLPPLQERPEDLLPLSEHFLAIYSNKYQKSQQKLSPATIAKFSKYRWPGNVRELKHAIERAVIMSDSDVLQPSDFFFSPQESEGDNLLFKNLDIQDVEKTVIRRALSKHHGNISEAARELGLTRAALYRRLEKYGI